MSINLEQYLAQFKGEDVIYIPNPGNAGDSVIATATYQMFDKIGLRYETPRFSKCDFADRIVIYGGGGNLIGQKTFSARVVGAAHAQAKRLVILPHTIKSVDNLLQAFNNNVDIICREAASYKYVSETSPKANTYLMDDVAFSLNVQDAIAGKPIISNPKRIFSYFINKTFTKANLPALANINTATKINSIRSKITKKSDSKEIFCFRTDGEKTDISVPMSNLDLSDILQFGVETKDVAYMSTRELLNFLSRFETVHTNRLHIGISSALLGLDVRFYANNYYKCRAVYEHSMKGKFDNVKWVE